MTVQVSIGYVVVELVVNGAMMVMEDIVDQQEEEQHL
jgi:hypothetical protein